GEHFWDWAPERNLTTGAVRLTDYDFKAPMRTMEINRLGDAAYAEGQIESFDYPGDYLSQDVGKIVAGLRTDQERGADRRNRAVGDCVSLGAGMRVTLSGDPVPGTGETYLCLSASHHFVSEAYGSGGPASDGYAFTGSYVLMPDTAPMAPPRRTPAALVNGPQTAMVVGEGEIDCDEYGRILVRFHWDLEGAHSMRCRVSQNWAGSGWGGMVIPRIGMEVLVEFLEGDPDKPVVVGNVFNGKNGAPYPLPEHKTRSTFRTKSHDGKGAGRGFNELRFEDEKDWEEIFIHAQRDMNIVTRRDHLTSVDRSAFLDVGAEYMSRVTGNFVSEVGGTIEISSAGGTIISAGPQGHSGTGHQPIQEGENQHFDQTKIRLKAMNSAIASGGLTLSAQTSLVEDVGTSRLTFIKDSAQETVGKHKSIHAGKLLQANSGGSTLFAAADNTAIESGSRIDIVCGASAIRLHASGKIEISGLHIKLDANRIDQN
ncbi:MAG: type VI secretion system tip protein TssI/VgrG, partial [Paracoccus sp. (in: a-proteobacteria)]|uniref:type VI secretion system Vgr family protein n=1 Tax=Paracoccus sp. TaxID=267 RepID=UPI0026E0260F